MAAQPDLAIVRYARELRARPKGRAARVGARDVARRRQSGVRTAGRLRLAARRVELLSPIWKETILTWKSSAKPVLITSDTQVDQLEHKGQLTERKTSTRLNCPIVKVGGAG
jgi:hypothetical protein